MEFKEVTLTKVSNSNGVKFNLVFYLRIIPSLLVSNSNGVKFNISIGVKIAPIFLRFKLQRSKI